MMQDACYRLAFADRLKEISYEIIDITPGPPGCHNENPRFVMINFRIGRAQ